MSEKKILSARLLLDSDEATYNSQTKELHWSAVNYTEMLNGVDYIQMHAQDICGVKFEMFRMAWNWSTSDIQHPIITMCINELPHGVLAHGRRYHSMYQITETTSFLPTNTCAVREFLPVCDTYWFEHPINELTSITISIANPIKLLDLPHQLHVSSEQYTKTNPTIINTGEHHYTTGQTIYITGFNTNDPIGDSVQIAAINNVSGLICTVIDNLHISIPINLTAISLPTQQETIIINRAIRVIFPIEIYYLNESRTV
jgi:hypothetical protein